MNEYKIVSIADNHGELDFKLPSGDILTICGDICPVRGSHHPVAQEHWIKNYFLPWCDKLIKDNIFNNVVFCNGNHDFYFEKLMKDTKETDFRLTLPKNVYYLRDNMVEIDGIKIYGTPFTPTFGRWANMCPELVLDQIFEKIPEGLDILLAHGPAYGWNDVILKGPYKNYSRIDDHIGSTSLRKHILRAKPKHFCYGHIHECSHKPLIIPHVNENLERVSETVSTCVSILDDEYEFGYDPYVFVINKE